MSMLSLWTIGEIASKKASASALVLLWITATNLVAAIVSLGLLQPWAAVRIYRYICYQTKYRLDLEDAEFSDYERSRSSSFGEEFAGLEGIDMSI